MPLPGVTPPKFPASEPEVRRALPVYDRPSWLDGKRTYIGLIISAAGMLGKTLGVDVPTEEINGLFAWLSAHWDDLAEAVGLAYAAYGRVKASKRFKK